jgi:predicted metal-dependent phosphotriesterase family hydrolase
MMVGLDLTRYVTDYRDSHAHRHILSHTFVHVCNTHKYPKHDHKQYRAVHAVGGSLVVDVTSPNMGRNARALLRLSEKTGVRIVMGCGYSYARTHPPYLVSQHLILYRTPE